MRWVSQHKISEDDDYDDHHHEEDIHNVDDNVDYDNDDEKTRTKKEFPAPVQYKLCTPRSVMEYSYLPNNSADTNHTIIHRSYQSSHIIYHSYTEIEQQQKYGTK